MNLLVLPAVGLATRLGGIPKFLLPCGDRVSLIERHIATVPSSVEVMVPTTETLAPIVAKVLGSRARIVPMATKTMSETVRKAIQIQHADRVAIGLPDTYCEPSPDYGLLLDLLSDYESAVAVFRTRKDQRGRLGAVRISGETIAEVRDKAPDFDSDFHWGAVAFRHDALVRNLNDSDPHVGFALESLVHSGGLARVASISDVYFDFGTFDEVLRAYAHLSGHAVA